MRMGTRVQCKRPSSREMGAAEKGAVPSPEPGAKPFPDNLLPGRGFECSSRATPSLRSIESQSSKQGFVKTNNNKKTILFLFSFFLSRFHT